MPLYLGREEVGFSPARADVGSCSCRTRRSPATPAREAPSIQDNVCLYGILNENQKKGGGRERGKKKIRCISACTSLLNTSVLSHMKWLSFFPL